MWQEQGLAVYFSYHDLLEQSKLSSDSEQPWKRVCDDVLWIARRYRQTYVTVWYPRTFGTVSDITSDIDPQRLTNVIREIVPTRTGLNELRSTAVVWLSLPNDTQVFETPRMYKKEWTEEDHWTLH